MISSLGDSQVQAAFVQATKPSQHTVQVGRDTFTIPTPYPSPHDWRDVWIYFLMIDRFNRSDGSPPHHMPYNDLFDGFQGGTFNGVREESAKSWGELRLQSAIQTTR